MLPFIVVLAALPAAPPSASPAPTKLQEIGRVRATICTPIVMHANGAIASALDNDRSLAILTTNLRATDFNKLNELQRRNAILALGKQTSAVRERARAADGEVKILRKLAADSQDATRKAELKAFADALGGAIFRQQRAAESFDRAMVIVQGRKEAAEGAELMDQNNYASRMLSPQQQFADARSRAEARPPQPPRDDEWNRLMHDVADTLDERLAGVAADEGTAADHSIPAATGC